MAQAHSPDANIYFVPHSSKWPFVGSIAMFVTMFGVASWLNDAAWGKWTFFTGVFLDDPAYPELNAAIDRATLDLSALQSRLEKESDPDKAKIFAAHAEIIPS